MSHNKPTTDQIQISAANTLNDAIDSNGVWVGNSDIPQNKRNTSYTLALSDRGKHISTTANVVIPANSSVNFPIGSAVVIFNANTSNVIVSITSDTLMLAATNRSGQMNLVANGMATLLKVANTTWVGTGIGFG